MVFVPCVQVCGCRCGGALLCLVTYINTTTHHPLSTHTHIYIYITGPAPPPAGGARARGHLPLVAGRGQPPPLWLMGRDGQGMWIYIYIILYNIYIYTYKCTYIHKKGSMYHTHAHPDGFWQAWDVAGGECVLTLEGHENGKRSTSKKHTHTHTHTYIYIHTQRKRELQTGVSVLGLPTGDVATASTGREEVGCGFPSFFLPCVVD